MSEYIQIQWTCKDEEEAKKISRLLIENRYVACANILPRVESIFSWKGRIESAQESKVLLKTLSSNFEAIKEIINENSSYDVPEIISFPIEHGNEEYLNWMKESCSPPKETKL